MNLRLNETSFIYGVFLALGYPRQSLGITYFEDYGTWKHMIQNLDIVKL